MNYIKYNGKRIKVSNDFIEEYNYYLIECTSLEEAMKSHFKIHCYILGRIDNEQEYKNMIKVLNNLIEKVDE